MAVTILLNIQLVLGLIINGSLRGIEISQKFLIDSRGVDVWSFGYNRNSEAANYTSSYELISLLIKTVNYK
jgi:hypothetical protein